MRDDNGDFIVVRGPDHSPAIQAAAPSAPVVIAGTDGAYARDNTHSGESKQITVQFPVGWCHSFATLHGGLVTKAARRRCVVWPLQFDLTLSDASFRAFFRQL